MTSDERIRYVEEKLAEYFRNIDERIKYAEEKRDEAIDREEWNSSLYWIGYIDGLYAAKRLLR